MSISIQKGILHVPDEILEDNLLTLLSFDDLMNLMKIGNVRLIRCCGAVMKKKQLEFKGKVSHHYLSKYIGIY